MLIYGKVILIKTNSTSIAETLLFRYQAFLKITTQSLNYNVGSYKIQNHLDQ